MTAPILVTGADGMLGSAIVRAAERQGVPVVGLSKQECNITNDHQVTEVLARYPLATVINCAGIVRQRTDVEEGAAAWVNTVGPHVLAFHADRLLQVSTDCVFDGAITEGAYHEESPPCPADHYGRSKLFGEIRQPPHLTVRVSFVGLGQRGLLHWLLQHPEGAEVEGYRNWLWNGWTTSALAPMLLAIAADKGLNGLMHLPGPFVMTKGWLLEEIAHRLRPDLQVVQVPAPEDRRMVLGSGRLQQPFVPSLLDMLDALEAEYRALGATGVAE